ncbi:MAG: transglutaminase family protein [Pseudomonadota bacterium]
MRYLIEHLTEFRYTSPVASSRQRLHLTPRSFDRQKVLRSTIECEPGADSTTEGSDYFGNAVVDLAIRSEHRKLAITARSRVDVQDQANILLDLSPAWDSVAAALQAPGSPAQWDASRFCFPSPWVVLDGVHRYAAMTLTPGKPLLRAAMELTERIYREFEYKGGVTDVYTPVASVLKARQGVCQDFAHLAIAVLRACGLPARYVSGYLETHPAPGQPKLQGADASHAWFSVWCPEFGWVDFDPTNNLMPGVEHITVGWGRDYGDVAPTVGVIRGGGRQRLKVAVSVTRED